MDINAFKPRPKYILARIPKQVTTTTDSGIVVVGNSQRNGRYVSAEIMRVGDSVPNELHAGVCVYIYPQAYQPVHTTPTDSYYVIGYNDAIGVCELGIAGDHLDVDALFTSSDVKRIHGDNARVD